MWPRYRAAFSNDITRPTMKESQRLLALSMHNTAVIHAAIFFWEKKSIFNNYYFGIGFAVQIWDSSETH